MVHPGVLLADRYRVEVTIGRGGMAMVYRGHDELLDRPVAIKVLGPMAANATGSRQEFLNEARAAAALAHENIVRVYDAGVQATERYIVMEYVPGGSLFDVIQAEAPLPAPRTIEVARQIANALEYGHRHGIVHCDVKPQNILLDDIGRPKLVDFGISRSIAATGALTDTISGTAGYIAPEQLLGEKLDGRADIYALGCVVYEMLAGALPFESSNLAALATQRLVRPPVPLRQRNPRVPAALAECVMRAIEREPDQRFATAKHFSDALEASRSGIAPPAPIRPRPLTVQATRRRPVTAVIDRPQAISTAETGARIFWPIMLVILGVLILLGAIAAVEMPSLVGRNTSGVTIAVPSVTNQGLNTAATTLHQQGLNVDLTFKDTTGTDACTGRVLSQNPPATSRLSSGSSVTLVVSHNDQC